MFAVWNLSLVVRNTRGLNRKVFSQWYLRLLSVIVRHSRSHSQRWWRKHKSGRRTGRGRPEMRSPIDSVAKYSNRPAVNCHFSTIVNRIEAKITAFHFEHFCTFHHNCYEFHTSGYLGYLLHDLVQQLCEQVNVLWGNNSVIFDVLEWLSPQHRILNWQVSSAITFAVSISIRK